LNIKDQNKPTMQNFDEAAFRSVTEAMAQAQACALGDDLPEHRQDGEYVEWVWLFTGDVVHIIFLCLKFPCTDIKKDEFFAGYLAALEANLDVDDKFVLVMHQLKKWRKAQGEEWVEEHAR
jgi:hypothetical protein